VTVLEARIVVSSSQRLAKSSITCTSICTERPFSHLGHAGGDLYRATISGSGGHRIWNTINCLKAVDEAMWSFILMIHHIR